MTPGTVQRRTGKRKAAKRGTTGRFWKSGEPFIWTTGGAVTISLMMVAGLVLLVMTKGLGYFWPADLARFELTDGTAAMGQIVARERIPTPDDPERAVTHRIQVKVGNRDVYGLDFRWIDEANVARRKYPDDAVVLERYEWGDFYGTATRLVDGNQVVATGGDIWAGLSNYHEDAQTVRVQINTLERHDVGLINRRIETARLRINELRASSDVLPKEAQAEIARLSGEIEAARAEYGEVLVRIKDLRKVLVGPALVMQIADGSEQRIPVSHIVRFFRPNQMSWLQKLGLYLAKVWEFVAGEPRESNTEGGIFPAIFGTVLMVLVMTIAVVPVGVLAAVYLKEYAGEGVIVSALRVAIRNLAGVPSIVFGVFGMGFFIYFVGGGIDRFFFSEKLPAPTFGTGGILWAALTLALLTLPVVIVATEEGLTAVPNSTREASYALGATQFETVWKVVVPNAMPGILTGMILGIARATGEVAPLMMTGVVKLAPELPVDGFWPFVHLERKFMHLGFFIYDLGFQSPNVEAARPMVYATTLALLVVVFGLNIIGIVLRRRLRSRHVGASV